MGGSRDGTGSDWWQPLWPLGAWGWGSSDLEGAFPATTICGCRVGCDDAGPRCLLPAPQSSEWQGLLSVGGEGWGSGCPPGGTGRPCPLPRPMGGRVRPRPAVESGSPQPGPRWGRMGVACGPFRRGKDGETEAEAACLTCPSVGTAGVGRAGPGRAEPAGLGWAVGAVTHIPTLAGRVSFPSQLLAWLGEGRPPQTQPPAGAQGQLGGAGGRGAGRAQEGTGRAPGGSLTPGPAARTWAR